MTAAPCVKTGIRTKCRILIGIIHIAKKLNGGMKMKIALCIDDKNGMTFNKRRQSRDRVLIDDLVKLCSGSRLLMNSYSAPLFADYQDSIEVREDFLDAAGEDDICFVENIDLLPYENMITGIILYRWNRHYPSDRRLTIDLSGFQQASVCEFAGSSHDNITREVLTK